MSAENAYNTSKAASGELVDSLLGGTALNFIGHRAFIHKASLVARCAKTHVKLGEMARQKNRVGGQERNRLHRSMSNGAWLRSVTHSLNRTELFREEFRDIICLRYRLMPQDIPTICNGCDKKLLIEHALSFPKGSLVFVQNDDAKKEWSNLGSRSLVPSAINYEPKINSRIVQGERTGQDRGRTVEQLMAVRIL